MVPDLVTIRTNSTHPDFARLVGLLDAELAQRDRADHPFYSQFNKIDHIRYVVLAYEARIPLGCGALREYDRQTMEVKRMYVCTTGRRKGVATRVLAELEGWARGLGFTRCILETGKRQPEAIELYRKNGYLLIPNYGQYAGVTGSVCFEKLMN
jgi:GNAT superfamily N-acetyltransferase